MTDAAGTRYVPVPSILLDALAAGLSPDAFALGVVMLSHVNRKRGDWVIWPSRQVLASKMNLRKADSIDKYVRELEKHKLIEVERRQEARTKTKNRYVLTALAVRAKEIPPEQGPSIPPDQGVSTPPKQGASMPPEQGVELKEENQTNKPKDSAGASSSSPNRRDDDDAQTRKIQRRKDQEHRTAVRDIAERLKTTDWHADATVAYLHEMADGRDEVIGNIDRYVAGCPDRELQKHHDTIAWQIDGWIKGGEELAGKIAEQLPVADPTILDAITDAYIAARHRGHDIDDIYRAINAIHTNSKTVTHAYAEAIDALGELAAS